jgi:predicted O-linked N-acetylglucosamine transferase (SPINDLY family)
MGKAMARDPGQLREMRSGLKERAARSELGDSKGMARAMEEAYFAMAREKGVL